MPLGDSRHFDRGTEGNRIAGITMMISPSEYLHTSYRPDREYIDGELRERQVEKWEHARAQWLLAVWSGNHEDTWNVIGSTEQRVQDFVCGHRRKSLGRSRLVNRSLPARHVRGLMPAVKAAVRVCQSALSLQDLLSR